MDHYSSAMNLLSLIKRSPSSFERANPNRNQPLTINPTCINNSNNELAATDVQLHLSPADLSAMTDAMTPICPQRHTTLSLDHSFNTLSPGADSTVGSFGSCSTETSPTSLSASSATSASSSRRESVANSIDPFTSAFSPSPVTQSIHQSNNYQSCGLPYPSTQLSYEGSTMPAPEERPANDFHGGQINIMADGLFQNSLFTESLTELPSCGVDSQGYGSGQDQLALAFPMPVNSLPNGSQFLPLAPASCLASGIEDSLLQASMLAYVENRPSSPSSEDGINMMLRHNIHLQTLHASRFRKYGSKRGHKHMRTFDQQSIPVVGSEARKPHKCRHCKRGFTRHEHRERHKLTHPVEPQEKFHCPMRTICQKEISNRYDNMKAHIKQTHFSPTQKKKSEKINQRVTMKELYEEHQAGINRDTWMEFLRKSGSINSPDELWERMRRPDIDARWNRLLSGSMTIQDKAPAKAGESTKPTRYWTMIGWSILEAQTLRIKDIVPEWHGSPDATLWDLDPRVEAMMKGTLKLEDAEFLGVDMMTSKKMGLELHDIRWQTLSKGLMSTEDAEKNGVGHLLPSRRKRCGARLQAG